MKIVKLDPKTWDRGREDSMNRHEPDVLLLGEDGRMCCMGFAALAFGATARQIQGCGTWTTCKNHELAARDQNAGNDNRFGRLYELNDDRYIGLTDEQRVLELNKALTEMDLDEDEDFRFELATEPKMDKAEP